MHISVRHRRRYHHDPCWGKDDNDVRLHFSAVQLRPGHEIVDRRARFSIQIQDNFKLISDYPLDLPDFRLSEVVRWPAFKCARCHSLASEWTWSSGVQVHVQSECKIKAERSAERLAALAKLKLFANQKYYRRVKKSFITEFYQKVWSQSFITE